MSAWVGRERASAHTGDTRLRSSAAVARRLLHTELRELDIDPACEEVELVPAAAGPGEERSSVAEFITITKRSDKRASCRSLYQPRCRMSSSALQGCAMQMRMKTLEMGA